MVVHHGKLIKSKKIHEGSFITVTPGIRLVGDDINDQKRVATPAKARVLGSDYIVVGRSITQVLKILKLAYQNVVKEWSRCSC